MTDHHRILIVDDQTDILEMTELVLSGAGYEVSTATSGIDALDHLALHPCDLVLLDINMPVMDGLTTLKHIMIESPKPTVMVSTLTQEGASVTFDALKFGAVDFVSKPSNLDESKLEATFKNVPERTDLPPDINEQLVVELYSK